MGSTINKKFQSSQRKFAATEPVKQYLTFMLGNDEYAIEILRIQEIKSFSSLNLETVSNAPAYFKGFTNLNGVIVPIIDLRSLYQTGSSECNEVTVVIVLQVMKQTMAVIATNVIEILSLTDDQIKPATFYETMIHHANVLGIGVLNDRMVTILDPDKLFINDIAEISKFKPQDDVKHD